MEWLNSFFQFLTTCNRNDGVMIAASVCLVCGIFITIAVWYTKHKNELEGWIIQKSNEVRFKEQGRALEYDKKIVNLEEEIDIMKRDLLDTKQDIIVTKDNVSAMSKNLDILIAKLDGYIEEDKKRAVVTYRHQLYLMHKEYMERGSVTPTELKNFTEMVNEYERCGGNDIVHNRIKPDVMGLPISYSEGSY